MKQHRRDPVKEQFWRDSISEQRESGLSVRAYCREHRLSEPSFYAWRRELTRRDGRAADGKSSSLRNSDSPRNSSKTKSPQRGGRGVGNRQRSVGRRTSRPSASRKTFLPLTMSDTGGPCQVEVVLPDGVRLRVGRGCDAATLGTVLSALTGLAVLEERPC